MPSRPTPLSRARATRRASLRCSGRFTAAGRPCARLCSLHALPRRFPLTYLRPRQQAISQIFNPSSPPGPVSFSNSLLMDGRLFISPPASERPAPLQLCCLRAPMSMRSAATPKRTGRSMPPSHSEKTLTSSICCSRTAPRSMPRRPADSPPCFQLQPPIAALWPNCSSHMEPIPRIKAMKARRLPTLLANGATSKWPPGSNPSKTQPVLTAPMPVPLQ